MSANGEIGNTKLDRKSRLSLPQNQKNPQDIKSQRRNTIAEYNHKPKKKPKPPLSDAIPTILENDDDISEKSDKTIGFVVENETKGVSKVKRKPSTASKTSVSSKATYDNIAYEGNLKRSGSGSNSMKTSSRAPSVQSLEVIQEQYCCFAKRTKCERSLLVTVAVLVIIIIVLVIVIAVLAKNTRLDHLKTDVFSKF